MRQSARGYRAHWSPWEVRLQIRHVQPALESSDSRSQSIQRAKRSAAPSSMSPFRRCQCEVHGCRAGSAGLTRRCGPCGGPRRAAGGGRIREAGTVAWAKKFWAGNADDSAATRCVIAHQAGAGEHDFEEKPVDTAEVVDKYRGLRARLLYLVQPAGYPLRLVRERRPVRVRKLSFGDTVEQDVKGAPR